MPRTTTRTARTRKIQTKTKTTTKTRTTTNGTSSMLFLQKGPSSPRRFFGCFSLLLSPFNYRLVSRRRKPRYTSLCSIPQASLLSFSTRSTHSRSPSCCPASPASPACGCRSASAALAASMVGIAISKVSRTTAYCVSKGRHQRSSDSMKRKTERGRENEEKSTYMSPAQPRNRQGLRRVYPPVRHDTLIDVDPDDAADDDLRGGRRGESRDDEEEMVERGRRDAGEERKECR